MSILNYKLCFCFINIRKNLVNPFSSSYFEGNSLFVRFVFKSVRFLLHGLRILSRFSTGGIFRPSGKPIVFHRIPPKAYLKSQIKFNFSAAKNSANQSYCPLCVPRDQNNSRSVQMIPSSGKPALRIKFILGSAHYKR